jgi:hypothetical protein
VLCHATILGSGHHNIIMVILDFAVVNRTQVAPQPRRDPG